MNNFDTAPKSTAEELEDTTEQDNLEAVPAEYLTKKLDDMQELKDAIEETEKQILEVSESDPNSSQIEKLQAQKEEFEGILEQKKQEYKNIS